jgi:hypothetical protein
MAQICQPSRRPPPPAGGWLAPTAAERSPSRASGFVGSPCDVVALPGRSTAGLPLVGMPRFEPHQPVPRRTDVSTIVRLTCMLAADVCCDVQVYAHRR